MAIDLPPQRDAWRRLSRAAVLSLVLHLAAGLALALVLWRGLETNADWTNRLTFLSQETGQWTAAWLLWHAAALSVLYFFVTFAAAHETGDSGAAARLRLALLLGTAGVAADLAAQAILMGVLPKLAAEALMAPPQGAFAGQDSIKTFLIWHRAAIMLTGYLANGLYTVATILLVWTTRKSYSILTLLAGMTVGAAGLTLSAAALADSPMGMLGANVALVPGILLWQFGVAATAGQRGRSTK